MVARLSICLNTMNGDSLYSDSVFDDMFNTIHIDEKWFYMTKGNQKYYILPSELRPYRSCKSKRFIQKVMFFAAIARPRFNSSGECTFDGKLGNFPFVRRVPAKRNSRKKRSGTLELKPIMPITKEAYRKMLIERLLPAIVQKWPSDDRKPIYIQQDNARPHIQADEFCWFQAVQASNRDIRLVCQPPNSPDSNVLDLGFFRAIQALKDQTSPRNCQELVKNVKDAYNDFCPKKGNKVFLSLQLLMIEIMKVKGSNRYEQRHVGKTALERQRILPLVFSPSPELIQECFLYLEALQFVGTE
ncbi:uncharacterized protein LOC104899411 [Beta vulgaris subsp. vulgaris]|uniref:uncharacterized protein LOC104899411 n=1 Tax=Beta vulgaris subsp. vulgaris TaxID=3555 RepID=UPI00053F700E|nr:uncharacterized protein LOC104899411 [Beta vulgaris subsp. vulgaris]